MLEIILCSLVTILPDFLIRRFVQGKRLGREITYFSVWYELRYGIVACLVLTVLLITVIFYNHPSTTRAVLYYRAVPIVPEINGRVDEIFISPRDTVSADEPLFRLDSTSQEAALETARRRIDEIDAERALAEADAASARGRIAQAEGALRQAEDELASRSELRDRNPATVPEREIERLVVDVDTQRGAVEAARALAQSAAARLEVVLPAQRASAEAQLVQAEADLAKTVVRAGVAGRIEQFSLRVGEVVNPFMRPAGVLIPDEDRDRRIGAGFGQIEAQVMVPGMYAEITCAALPLTIIPMVVVDVQPVLASGQVRAGDQLADISSVSQIPGTILAFLEPLHPGGLDALPLGSNCIANAYTSNHDRLATGEVSGIHALYLHAVDTLAMVHALILRMQTLVLPVQALVLTGH